MRVVDPNGDASCAACSLGALAGRKALLLPCVTLLSEGKHFGIAKAAISQAVMKALRRPGDGKHVARRDAECLLR
jgi:hypothetical protein